MHHCMWVANLFNHIKERKIVHKENLDKDLLAFVCAKNITNKNFNDNGTLKKISISKKEKLSYLQHTIQILDMIKVDYAIAQKVLQCIQIDLFASKQE